MKSLKITLVAICSVVLLTGVHSFNGTTPTKENSNKEVKRLDVKLLATNGIKKNKVPSQG